MCFHDYSHILHQHRQGQHGQAGVFLLKNPYFYTLSLYQSIYYHMLALAMFLVKDMAEITKAHIKLTTYGLKEKLNCTTTLSRFCEVVKLIKNHLKGHKTEMHWLQSTQHGTF